MDSVRSEKEKAMTRFYRFRVIVRLWQFFQLLVGFGMISWSSARVPAVLKTTGGYLVELSSYLFNHHVVFLLGNAIVVTLFMLCRQNDEVNISATSVAGDDIYNFYLKYGEEDAHQRQSTPAPPPDDEECSSYCEKDQDAAHTEENTAMPKRDDVDAAIEEASKLISRFQRMQSAKLKRDIAVRPRPQNRKREADNRQNAGAVEIENLSSEEFRRRVDAFIDKHWCSKGTAGNQLKQGANYHLLKITQ